MLVELSIKDFAIIESLAVSLGPGLNIFTGETGAGKSIIMDAIALILGDRASNDIIRSSAEEARVEALFDTSGMKSLEGVLKEAGIETSDSLVIRRIVQRAGRNKIYINGSLATLVTLTEVGRRLIDIYGQSEHQSLTRPDEHIEILDSFGGLKNLRAYMAEASRGYSALKKEFDSLTQDSKNLSEKRELIAYQLKEITDAAPQKGEDEELKKLLERLKNSERLKSAASEAEKAVYSDEGSVTERLGRVVKVLKDAAVYDERVKKAVEPLTSALYSIEDAGAYLRDYSESIEADPESLEAAAGRLDNINKLKKKYGPSMEDVIAKKETLEGELSAVANLDGRIKECEGGLKAAREKAIEAAKNLSEARANAAADLEKKIEKELKTLGMKDSVFEVSIEAEKNPDGTPRFTEKGSDRVSFFISTNKGEELKPLSRIASGGELSRIMLAMKSVTAVGRVPTLIFDEIDTGVGGAMAQVVGLKMKEVSGTHQVLSITHLPQIAAFADRHFKVSKGASGDGRTVTSVKELEGKEPIDEISAMLGGLKVTDVTRKQAVELIETAKSLSSKKGKRKAAD